MMSDCIPYVDPKNNNNNDIDNVDHHNKTTARVENVVIVNESIHEIYVIHHSMSPTNKHQMYSNNNRYSDYHNNIWSFNRVSWIFILIYVISRITLLVKADPMCDIIAATNIQSISGYSQWSCTTAGVTSTAPCTSPLWNGIACTGNSIIVVSISNNGLTGKFDLHRHEHK